MKARDYLMQVKKIDKMIDNKLIERMQWKDIATGTSASSDGDRVQSSGTQQKMADAVCRAADIEREIDILIDRLIDIKQDVVKTIEILPADEYDIIHKVYIQYININDVAVILNRSYESVRRTHNKGVNIIQEYLNKNATKCVVLWESV